MINIKFNNDSKLCKELLSFASGLRLNSCSIKDVLRVFIVKDFINPYEVVNSALMQMYGADSCYENPTTGDLDLLVYEDLADDGYGHHLYGLVPVISIPYEEYQSYLADTEEAMMDLNSLIDNLEP